MLKRVVHLSVASSISIWALACASGAEDNSSFGTFGVTSQQTTQTTVNDSMDDEDDLETGDDMGDGDQTGDGDGDQTGDGDGDGDQTGDGDGDQTGDGDGDQTGDGDGDPGPSCGNGVLDPGETCDGNDFNGATCQGLGYDMGTLTCTNCAVSTATCSNAPQPGLGQLYSHCLANENCPGLGACVTVTMQGQMNPFDGYCTNFCNSDAQCFANVGGNAVPRCNNEPDRYCELDCSGGKTCPGGMACINLQGGKQLCF
jgi:hypothetical protein